MGDKDRRAMLPDALKDDLNRQMAVARSVFNSDRKANLNGVYLPGALEKKYPNAGNLSKITVAS